MTTKLKLTSKPSPITTETVALAGYSFSDLQASTKKKSSGDANGVYFCCRDPSNSGKSCIQSVSKGSNITTSHEVATITDTSHNVRSAVHEYGGGAYCVVYDGAGRDDEEEVIYTDFPSHVVYSKQASNKEAKQIFPAPHQPDSKCRLANFTVIRLKNGSNVLLSVMEDHTDPKPANVKNSIVTVSLDGKGVVETLASGHDFYTSPCYDAESHRIAYVSWNHPNMPWDATTLYVQDCTSKDSTAVVAVHDKQSSVYAPTWHKGKLYFLSNATGWYNLYCWDGATTVNLLPMDADFSEASCGWILGVKCFTFLNDGTTLVATYTPQDGDGSRVVLIDTANKTAAAAAAAAVQEFGRSCLPPSSIGSLTASGNSLYFLGGSPTTPTGIWCWERPGDDSCQAVEVLPSMQAKELTEIGAFMSKPRHIQFPSDAKLGLGYAYGYYYPPIQGPATGKEEVKPPLLVKAHGGPTSRTSTTFRLDIQFWTSRGFAVLDVDYGGSSGYGKEFQQSLQGQWGLLDVADVCNGAKYLVQQGWVNPAFLCIDGRSAGGYTTLAALAFADTFRAGASLYGIGDLLALADGTHKFESRYLDGLIGPYPEQKEVYEKRCPVNFTDNLNCPVILLQGDEDKVVPPDQAEEMFNVLTARGLPSSLVIYKGEQHGFRKAQNIGHALLSEYFFFCETFGIEPQAEGDFAGVQIGARVEI